MTFFRSMKNTVCLLSACFLIGCVQAPKRIYQWGNYEALVYENFKSDGKTPLEQIDEMNVHLDKIKASNSAVPPGFYAHLGYLMFRVGRDGEGATYMEQEKLLFPESAKFIDMLLVKSRGSKQ